MRDEKSLYTWAGTLFVAALMMSAKLSWMQTIGYWIAALAMIWFVWALLDG